ncbi:unnamed protein product [Orchesella dallaii]|uniref:Uncharacterized protein n=1 Tax=Orchesella dallaii TaxID=48710 RepID=A0ABP1RTQ4_9HEXA
MANDPHELVNGLNCLALLKRRIDIEFRPHLNTPNYHLDVYWKWISEGLKLTVVTFFGIMFTFPIAIIAMHVDPFIFTFPLLFPDVSVHRLILLRFTVIQIWVFECCRFNAIYFPTFFYMLELQTRCLDALKSLPLNKGLDVKFFKWYSALRIADQSYKGPMSSMIGILMANGFVIFTVCNVVTIKGFHILPLEVYWFAPTVSVLCAFFIYFLLPIAIESHKRSQQLIWARASAYMGTVGPLERKLIRKKSRALRPVTFHCGPLMALEIGVDREYFAGIFLRTVDGLLL